MNFDESFDGLTHHFRYSVAVHPNIAQMNRNLLERRQLNEELEARLKKCAAPSPIQQRENLSAQSPPRPSHAEESNLLAQLIATSDVDAVLVEYDRERHGNNLRTASLPSTELQKESIVQAQERVRRISPSPYEVRPYPMAAHAPPSRRKLSSPAVSPPKNDFMPDIDVPRATVKLQLPLQEDFKPLLHMYLKGNEDSGSRSSTFPPREGRQDDETFQDGVARVSAYCLKAERLVPSMTSDEQRKLSPATEPQAESTVTLEKGEVEEKKEPEREVVVPLKEETPLPLPKQKQAKHRRTAATPPSKHSESRLNPPSATKPDFFLNEGDYFDGEPLSSSPQKEIDHSFSSSGSYTSSGSSEWSSEPTPPLKVPNRKLTHKPQTQHGATTSLQITKSQSAPKTPTKIVQTATLVVGSKSAAPLETKKKAKMEASSREMPTTDTFFVAIEGRPYFSDIIPAPKFRELLKGNWMPPPQQPLPKQAVTEERPSSQELGRANPKGAKPLVSVVASQVQRKLTRHDFPPPPPAKAKGKMGCC